MHSFKKPSIRFLLAVAAVTPLVFSRPGVAQTRNYQFSDTANYWAEACIEGAGEEALMKGYLNGSFQPNGTMTRAEFAAVIIKAFPAAAKVREAPNFTDVAANFWGRAAIATAYERGFLAGYPDNSFKPAQPISRAQAIIIIENAVVQNNPRSLPLAGQERETEALLARYFDDAVEIPDYAKALIASATSGSLVVNYPIVRQLRPNASITRGEATALLCRVNETGSDARHYVPAQYVAAFGSQSGANQLPNPTILGSIARSDRGLIEETAIVNQQLMFVNESNNLATLWKTDGTVAGTQRVKELIFAPAGMPPYSAEQAWIVGSSDQRVWLSSWEGEGENLRASFWSSDGTTAGTRAIASLSPTLSATLDTAEAIRPFDSPFKNRLPFVVSTQQDTQLWLTDGVSDGGTQRLATFSNGQTALSPQRFVSTSDYLFFVATAPNISAAAGGNPVLWRSAGTANGTIALPASVETGYRAYSDITMTAVQNRLYFTAITPEAGSELWTSDGSAAGTLLLKDFYPGAEASTARVISHLGSTAFVVANSPEGTALWATEGTPESTRKIKQLSPQADYDGDVVYTVHDGKLFFGAPTGTAASRTDNGFSEQDFGLWVTDGTAAGTQSLNVPISIYGSDFASLDDQLFFGGQGPNGYELWRSDGTAEGTQQVLDLTPGTATYVFDCPAPAPQVPDCPSPIEFPNSSGVRSFNVQGNFLYFMARDGNLFRTDGTGRGIQLVGQFNGTEVNGIQFSPDLIRVGEKLVVRGYSSDRRRMELWGLPE